MQIVCLLLLLSISAFSQNRSIRFTQFNGATYLYLADIASFYGLQYKVNDKKIFLTSKSVIISFSVNNRLMVFNGVQVYLSRAVAVDKKIYLIGKSDFQLVLEPLMRKSSVPKRAIRKIVVDAGHGGKDVGAIFSGTMEKEINLKVATLLAQKLRQAGFEVVMTRTKDVDMSLEERTAFTAKSKADLFISIHCNSAAASVKGLEVYVATPAGDYNTGDNAPQKVACASNAYDKINIVLGYALQSTLLSKIKMADRGLRRKRFYVIRNAPCPSALVEIGYLSNSSEREELKKTSRQDGVAEAIKDSIVLVRNVTK